jgi:hypothetical protein
MWNKASKANKTLQQKITELNLIVDVRQGNNWKASLKDSIELHIGKDSSISKRLDELHFTRRETKVVPGVIGIFEEHIFDASKKADFKHLIESAINNIKSNGLFKPLTKNNFLGGFNNTEIISGIVGAILIVYGIGNYFGKLEMEREIIQSESKLKKYDEKNISPAPRSMQLTKDKHP